MKRIHPPFAALRRRIKADTIAFDLLVANTAVSLRCYSRPDSSYAARDDARPLVYRAHAPARGEFSFLPDELAVVAPWVGAWAAARARGGMHPPCPVQAMRVVASGVFEPTDVVGDYAWTARALEAFQAYRAGASGAA